MCLERPILVSSVTARLGETWTFRLLYVDSHRHDAKMAGNSLSMRRDSARKLTKKIRHSGFVWCSIRGIKGGWLNELVLREDMYLFGSLILAAISTCSAANGLNHFAYSCDSSTLSGTVLISNCQREDGSYVSSSIDLVDCLVNTNGILACRQKWVAYYFTCWIDPVTTYHY